MFVTLWLQYFSVDVYGPDDQVLSTDQLVEQLHQVVNQSQTKGPPLGIINTEARDPVFTAYRRLGKGLCSILTDSQGLDVNTIISTGEPGGLAVQLISCAL